MRLRRGENAVTVVGGVDPLARPVPVAGGVLVAAGGAPERGPGAWTLHRVTGTRAETVFSLAAPWLLPAGTRAGEACAVVGDTAPPRLVCGAGAATVSVLPGPRVRHAALGGTTWWTLTDGPRGWEIAGGSRRWPAPEDAGLVVNGANAAWGRGAGAGITVVTSGTQREVGALPGFAAAPVLVGDAFAVVRMDSVDARGRRDARLPARWLVLDSRTGAGARLRTGGSVVEVYGAFPAGREP